MNDSSDLFLMPDEKDKRRGSLSALDLQEKDEVNGGVRIALDGRDVELLAADEHDNGGSSIKKNQIDVDMMLFGHSMSETMILWLLSDGKNLPNMSVLLDQCLRLVRRMGIPIHRFHMSYFLNHPQAGARVWKWFGKGKMESFYLPRSFIDQRFKFAAPDLPFILLEQEDIKEVRVRSQDEHVSKDISWFRDENHSDYFALKDAKQDGSLFGACSCLGDKTPEWVPRATH